MAKIIVAAPPFPGDFTPLLQIGRGLAARGHQVTMLAWSSVRAAVEEAGLAFVPPAGAADYDLRKEVTLNAAQPPGPPQLNFGFSHSFIDPVPGLHTALQELLRQDPDQVPGLLHPDHRRLAGTVGSTEAAPAALGRGERRAAPARQRRHHVLRAGPGWGRYAHSSARGVPDLRGYRPAPESRFPGRGRARRGTIQPGKSETAARLRDQSNRDDKDGKE